MVQRAYSGALQYLETAMMVAGSRKKAKLAKFPLSQIGWGETQLAEVAVVEDALLRMVPLAPPHPDADVCLYTDASHDYWGVIVTQLPPCEASLPLERQKH